MHQKHFKMTGASAHLQHFFPFCPCTSQSPEVSINIFSLNDSRAQQVCATNEAEAFTSISSQNAKWVDPFHFPPEIPTSQKPVFN